MEDREMFGRGAYPGLPRAFGADLVWFGAGLLTAP
jgi:hypothetical protein